MSESVETIRGRKVAFAYASGMRPLTGYTIKRGIGVGGFGEVYFAINDAGKEVALKKIQRNLDVELRGVRQCLNLKHVNLIDLWDICTTEAGESWVVMEYVPGESLRDEILKFPRGMPLADVHRWFRSTAAGVKYLHDNGIVHRDLKPGNIFYDADEHVVKIGDYGLSKFISCSRRSGQTESVGTFHYMAPEIGKGVYGKEIDVYALGVILYEMLTGRLPFDGESAQEIIMKHLTSDVDLDPVSPEYRSVIFRCLAKDPDERYHSVDELMEEFPPPPESSRDRWDRYEPQLGMSSSAAPRPTAAPPPSDAPTPRDTPLPQPARPAAGWDHETYYIGDEPDIVFAAKVAGPIAPMVLPLAGGNAPTAERLPLPDPVFGAIHRAWNRGVERWNASQLSLPVKVVLLTVGIIILIANSAWLVPLATSFGLLYLVYLAIRSWLAPPHRPRRSPVVQMSAPPPPRRLTRRVLNQLLRDARGEQPWNVRAMELTGSLLASGLVCLLFGGLAYVLPPLTDTSVDLPLAAWLAITTLAASWAILIGGKQWENYTGDHLARRFWLLVLGALVGSVSYGAARFLSVDVLSLTVETFVEIPEFAWRERMFDADRQPRLILFVVFFASLFAALRWWRQADPIRNTRLSLLSVVICWLVAIVAAEVLRFPQLAASLIAVGTSVAVQIASPWLRPDQRQRIRQSVLSGY